MNHPALQVWLVDDDASIRWVLERALRNASMQPTTFDAAEPALTALRARTPDVLITDVRMPWMTGFQVALSARNSGLGIPIIIVTAFPDDALRAQVDHLGSAVLLAKPFRPEELLSLVRARLPAVATA